MNRAMTTQIQSQIVEDEIELTLVELCHACNAQQEIVAVWVFEGLLEPRGRQPEEWRFGGNALKRARTAMRLTRDLDINAEGIALVLDLMDEIDQLQAKIKRQSGF